MKQCRSWQWSLALLLSVVALASCTGDTEGADAAAGIDQAAPQVSDSEAPATSSETTTTFALTQELNRSQREVSWSLEAISPDGGKILIANIVGGGCSFDRGHTVESTDTEVVITANISTSGETSCTDELKFSSALIQLDAPLGDRSLRGCRTAATCLDVRTESPWPLVFGISKVVASDQRVVLANSRESSVYDPSSGELLAESSGFDQVRDERIAGDLVVGFDGWRRTKAFQVDTGEEVWERAGRPVSVDEELVVVCGERSQNELEAFDTLTGEFAWGERTRAGVRRCDSAAVVGESVFVLQTPPEGNRLVVVDKASGTVVSEREVQGSFERIFGFGDGAVMVGPNTAVVFDELGGEVSRTNADFGSPVAATGDVVVSLVESDLHDNLHRAYNVTSGEEVWTSTFDRNNPTFAVDASEAVRFMSGSLSLIDANTGEEKWSTFIGPFIAPPVLIDDRVFVSTPLFVASLDRANGEILWWTEVPPGPNTGLVTEN